VNRGAKNAEHENTGMENARHVAELEDGRKKDAVQHRRVENARHGNALKLHITTSTRSWGILTNLTPSLSADLSPCRLLAATNWFWWHCTVVRQCHLNNTHLYYCYYLSSACYGGLGGLTDRFRSAIAKGRHRKRPKKRSPWWCVTEYDCLLFPSQ